MTTINKYICEKCNYKTNIKSRWNAHISTELHKTGIKKKRSDCKEPIKCGFCDYETKNKTILNSHILNNHKTKEERKNEFAHYCACCDFGTFAIKSLNIHNETDKHKHSALFNK
jgi:hypothetical protein